mgnify:FL=1
MFHKILVGIDGSAHSVAALAHAIDIAQTENASLTLITALQPYPLYGMVGIEGALPAVEFDPGLDAALKADARGVLDAAAATVPADVACEARLVDGRVTDVLLDAIRSGNHDLVAIGSRGRGDITSMVLGSVSHNLIHHSPVPVLLVHLTAR